jgi:hypothetical protein
MRKLYVSAWAVRLGVATTAKRAKTQHDRRIMDLGDGVLTCSDFFEGKILLAVGLGWTIQKK